MSRRRRSTWPGPQPADTITPRVLVIAGGATIAGALASVAVYLAHQPFALLLAAL